MKLLTFLSSLLLLTACNLMPSEGDLNAAKAKENEEVSSVQFSLAETDIDAASQVLIEYTNASGESSQATLSLTANDQQLKTQALNLEPGEYTLTQFLVLTGEEVAFATPQQTSDLTQLIGENNALPLSFTVTAGKVTTLNPLVLSTGEGEGKDFLLSGPHSSSSWKSLIIARIAAFVPNASGNAVPTTATLSIQDGATTRVYRLFPTTNFILILSPAEQFTLTVTKEGYAPAQQIFSRAQLLNSLKPDQEIKVTLAPVETPSVSGRILDAAHGAPVGGVLVQVMSDNVEIAKTTTRKDGSYNLGNIPVGQYHIVISKNGYISYGQQITLAAFEHRTLRLPISRIMAANTMRIVLMWEDRGADFDAFLRILNASTNAEIDMIYWKDLSFRNNAVQAVFTTGDDRIGLGFESMQLKVEQLGAYKFQFFARQYQKFGHTTPFPLAGVTVKVFRGDSVMGIFDPNMLSQDPALKQYNVFAVDPDFSVVPVNTLQ